MTDRVGQQLGNYDLIELLGRGGFAEVYLGKHRHLQSYAALKLLRKRLNDADEEQFLAEARILVRLRHPHIVRVLDFAVEQGVPVLIMEYAPHGTLRERYPSGTYLPLASVIDFVLQIASALQYAHNHQVIHRDVKPANILLDAHQHLFISDFGLSLLSPSPELLSTQEPVGTFPYTSPEQLRGKPCFASDQYSLAIIAYEWLCGRLPFKGNAWELMHQHLYMAPPPLRDFRPELPAAVESVILRALAKDPAERFVSMQAFAQALVRASQQQFVAEDESQITASFKTALRSPLLALRSNLPGPPAPPEPYTPTQQSLPSSSSNRQRLLAKVRVFWITGVLEHSLYGATLLRLGLSQQPEAVANPWRLVLQQPGLTPQRLPVGTPITQAYDDANGELLILGEPGSGKTTLLLELARDLLERAEQDESHPMPVVFNLSSWSVTRQPLAPWLVDELNSKYQVPRKLAQAWIESDQILPLLDGLDEVTPAARSACLEAINIYRQGHGLLPTVVCSRAGDYFAQQTAIQLSSAVMVQPLTAQQVDDYLASGGEMLRALRVALYQDPVLRELTTTPLMLSILTLTYHDMPVEKLLREGSLTDRQRQVFEHYVERTLKRRGADSSYSPRQTISWLSWLARQLTQHSQSMFYMERMQPDWLEGARWQRWYPCLAAGLIFGLLAFLSFGPIGGLLLTNILHQSSGMPTSVGLLLALMLIFGIVSGSFFGLLNGLFYMGDAERKWWQRAGRRLVQGVLNGVLSGLLLGLPYGWLLGRGQDHLLPWLLTSGVITGLLGGIGFGLIDGLLGIRVATIRPAETFAWSWTGMGRNLLKFMLLGLLGSLTIGLLFGLLFWLYTWVSGSPSSLPAALLASLQFALVLTPFFVLIGGLLGGFTGGLSSEMLDVRTLTMPNWGIRRSARHGLLVGIAAGLIGFLIGGVLGGLVFKVHDLPSPLIFAFAYGLILGSAIGLVSALRGGLIACIQHVALRLLLWRADFMPWNCAHFLDYASERILLRKVGGGYIFTHRLLLDYLATLDSTIVPHASREPHEQYRLCACGYQDARPNSRFCPNCGRVKI